MATQTDAAVMTKSVDLTSNIDASTLANAGILVTGGCSGLGESFTRSFAALTSHVVIADLNEGSGQKLEQELIEEGYSVKFIKTDVSSWPSQVSLFQQALEWLTSKGAELDHIVNSAGVAGKRFDVEPADPLELSKATPPSSSVINIGLVGSMYTTQLAIKYGFGLHTSKDHDKSIILIGSLAGYRGVVGEPDYTASKFGVRGVFVSLRSELPSKGIRINLLAPYFIKTPLLQKSTAVLEAKGVRFGTVEKAAEAVLRFASNKSINGRVLCVHEEGLTDLEDDEEGGYSTTALADLAKRGVFLRGNPDEVKGAWNYGKAKEESGK